MERQGIPVNGVDKITEKIINEAKEYEQTVLAQAKSQIADIEDQYKSEADYTAASLSAQAEKEAEGIITRAKSSALMSKRNIILDAKSRLVDEAFENAAAEVKKLTGEQYLELLEKLLCDALGDYAASYKKNVELYGEDDAPVPERFDVVMSARDRKVYGDILMDNFRSHHSAKFGKNIMDRLRLAPDTADIDGGLILRYGDVESNCSVPILIRQLRDSLEGEVYAKLFAEK